MLIRKRILILGPFGELGGVRTHVEHLLRVLTPLSTKIRVSQSFFHHILKERLYSKPEVVIHNIGAYRNATIRDMIIQKIATSRNTKNILHLHGGVFSDMRFARNPFWQALLKYYFRGFDQIFCLTDEQYIAVKDSLGDLKKIKKISNYVEIPDRKLIDKSDQNLNLLYLGRLNPQKGIMDAVEAVRQLKEEKIKLWIIGAGELEAQLSEIQDSRIAFLGKKYGEDKNSFLSKAHVFLLPSSWSEGLPYGLLEAAAYGLALIATPVGAINQVLFHGKNGFFVEAGNVSMIAKQLKTFINDRELAIQMGEESRRICKERFSIDHLQDIYAKLFLKWFSF